MYSRDDSGDDEDPGIKELNKILTEYESEENHYLQINFLLGDLNICKLVIILNDHLTVSLTLLKIDVFRLEAKSFYLFVLGRWWIALYSGMHSVFCSTQLSRVDASSSILPWDIEPSVRHRFAHYAIWHITVL